jgi:hypothetical protein
MATTVTFGLDRGFAAVEVGHANETAVGPGRIPAKVALVNARS